MASSRWQRMRSGPQIWEISPTDWRFFGKNLIIGLVVIAVLLVIFQSFSPELRSWRALGFMLYAVSFAAALSWIPSAVARESLNRERERHGMPTKPVPAAVLVLVPLAIGAIGFLGRSLQSDDEWLSGTNVVVSLAGVVGMFGGMLIFSYFWRRKALESPANRAMLDREWYQLHGYPGAPPGDRSVSASGR